MVANTSFRAAPWADALFAMDLAWWRQYGNEARSVFRGSFHSTCGAVASEFNIRPVSVNSKLMQAHGNSGAGAMMLAFYAGARRVIMLGYDCQHTGGAKHWHGDHPPKLGNANRPEMWERGFAKVAHDLEGIEVINASRTTALTCFPQMDLEDALCIP